MTTAQQCTKSGKLEAKLVSAMYYWRTCVCVGNLPERTFPKIVAALPRSVRHAALRPLPIWTTVGMLMHAHAHWREVAPLPKLALVASVVAVGWLSARLAQDVVTAPARMSAQPNLPTSVRATLQFGPIYLATGGGRSSRDSGAVVKSVGCPTRPTGDLRQIIKVTSAAIFYLRRPLAFGGRLERWRSMCRPLTAPPRGQPGSLFHPQIGDSSQPLSGRFERGHLGPQVEWYDLLGGCSYQTDNSWRGVRGHLWDNYMVT